MSLGKPVMSIVDGKYDCHECLADANNLPDAIRHLVDDHGALEWWAKYYDNTDTRNGIIFVTKYALDKRARKVGAV